MPFSTELTGAIPSADRAKILSISLAAVPLTIVVCLLPQEGPVQWAWIGVAATIAIALAILLAREGMFTPAMRREIPEWQLVGYLSFFTFAAGIAAFAGSGPIGIFRPLLVIIIMWWAMWSDGMYLFYGTMLAIVTLGAASIAQGVPAGVAVTIMVEYGYCWAVTGVVVFMLVHQIHHTRDESQRLAETAQWLASLSSVAARSRHLEPALPTCLEFIAAAVNAERTAIVAVEGSEQSLSQVASWPGTPDGNVPTPATEPRQEAQWMGTATIDAEMSLLPIGTYDGDSLVLEIEHCPEVDRYAADGTIDSVVTVLSNMIERVSFMHSLEQLTRSDPLTGLDNRIALTESLEHEIDLARRNGGQVCVVMIDLDHFKRYNDTFGHLAGDQALRSVGEMLSERCRSNDIVARYGGEEFCLGFASTGLEQAAAFVETLLQSAREIEGEAPMTFSAGIAEWDGNEHIDALIRRADAALYEAKANGRDQAVSATRPNPPE